MTVPQVKEPPPPHDEPEALKRLESVDTPAEEDDVEDEEEAVDDDDDAIEAL